VSRSCPTLSRGGDTGVSRSRVVPDPFAKTLSAARMTSRHEKERAKQIQEKCQNLLTQMLRDEDNKYCVDCDAKGLFLDPDMNAPFIRFPFGKSSSMNPSCVLYFVPSKCARSWIRLVDIDYETT